MLFELSVIIMFLINKLIRHGCDIDLYGGRSSDDLMISRMDLELMIPRYKILSSI
jgi:hypothetical protein